MEMSKALDILYKLKGTVAAGPPWIPLLFVAKIDTVKLDLDRTTLLQPTVAASWKGGTVEYERFEQPWRDLALAALGLSSGKADIAQSRHKLMAISWAALPDAPYSAYVVFVTKYKVDSMAHADAAIAGLTMSYL